MLLLISQFDWELLQNYMFLVVNFIQPVRCINWLPSLPLILYLCRPNSSDLSFLLRPRSIIPIMINNPFNLKYWGVIGSYVVFNRRMRHMANSLIFISYLYNCWWISVFLTHCDSMTTSIVRNSEAVSRHFKARGFRVSFITSLPISLIINLVRAVLS